MAVHVQVVVVGLWLFFAALLVDAIGPHRRFEYKLSFKGPHLVQQDGTIPFWEHGGHAIASDESIRITPSLRSKKGNVWSKMKNTNEHWEIEVAFRISGRGRIGADGLAIWFTEEKGVEGNVFGSSDKWKGLAVIFDSFDNDNQHNNPYILAISNDGTLAYDHNTDGQNQQVGGCLRDFRNKPFPVRAKIEYYQGALTVMIHNGMSNNRDDFELCMRSENIRLPKEGYFGISGATGGLADDHDVHSFLTYSLTPPTDTPSKGQEVSEDERKKFEQEFDEYYQKLQKAKEDYRKEHPDKKPADEGYEYDDTYFETMDERQLKQIFDGQNNIHLTVREVHRKLDEIVGRQERLMSQVSMLSQGGAVQQGGQQQGQGYHPQSDYQPQFNTVMGNQRQLLDNIRDLSSGINELRRITQGGAGSQGGGDYAGERAIGELRNSINGIQGDVKSLINKPQQAPMCPPPPPVNCVSTFYFLFFMSLQCALVIGYGIYRSSKDAAAKKFY